MTTTAKHRMTSMKIPMDKILREIVEQVYQEVRLGRDRDFVDKNRVFSETLVELESEGDAMRYLDSQGRIRWRATPELKSYLLDLQRDAELDFESEDM